MKKFCLSLTLAVVMTLGVLPVTGQGVPAEYDDAPVTTAPFCLLPCQDKPTK